MNLLTQKTINAIIYRRKLAQSYGEKMGRKKRSIEDDRPIPTPERQLETKSGWCSTNYHNGCKYRFTFGKCGCQCHKEKR
jgi:hypothetical protein